MRDISKEVAIGVDIGGTKIKTVALGYPDRILHEHRIDSDAKHGPNAVRAAVNESIRYYHQHKITFSAIGLGCAGSVCPDTGIVYNSPNFANWKDVPLQSWVAEDFKLPTVVANDANCAAFTEWKMGNAKGHRNAVLLTFGTGVGGGLILDGKLYCGSTGTGGELGHFSIYADGVECACKNTGCFERYCSASALEKRHPGLSAKEIFSRAADREEPFYGSLQTFFQDLKIGITSVANMFDPDCILIGGGLSKGIMPYFPEIQTWLETHAFPLVAKHVKILPTKYFNQSGAIGAALLAFENLKVSE
jgi:glucokinase